MVNARSVEGLRARDRAGLIWLFTATLLLSAGLLFVIQPMVAKLLLPLLGGTPAVWNTCLVFFQALLLAGYWYAHVTTQWLGIRRQMRLHLMVLILPLLVLPFAVPAGWAPPAVGYPVFWLLAVLTVAVGLPFFVVATSAPLLQRWFAQTDHPEAHDPYFLYTASNAGSLVALLSYPFLIEPHVRLYDQRLYWAVGYAALVILTALAALYVWRSAAVWTLRAPEAVGVDVARPSAAQRLRWVLLAFIPSSLLLGVNTYLATDIVAMPLLWVVPLAVYLLTFVIVFARRPIVSYRLMVRLFPLVVLWLAVWLVREKRNPIWQAVPAHLLLLFVVGMICHGQLARERPATSHLTAFYLWISVGGVLGGLFNALAAPLLFTQVLEYPLAIVLACIYWPGYAMLRPTPEDARAPARMEGLLDVLLPISVGLILIVCYPPDQAMQGMTRSVKHLIMYGPAVLACFLFRYRPVRFALGLMVFLLVASWLSHRTTDIVYRRRNFFGIHRIVHVRQRTGDYFKLAHGTTLHGMQSLVPERSREALTYYHAEGPIGQVIAARGAPEALAHVAVVGLGTGSLAAYAQPGQEWTFYEIDPAVRRIAEDPLCFTFLSECRGTWRVVLGDARRSLLQAPDGRYDLIVVDAFSSDAIPIHLMTREALELYLAKLAPGGVIAFHVSNRYLLLEPVLGNLGGASGLACLAQSHRPTPEALERGASKSTWVLIARRWEDFGPLAQEARWKHVAPQPQARLWTDDFSNLLGVFRWR